MDFIHNPVVVHGARMVVRQATDIVTSLTGVSSTPTASSTLLPSSTGLSSTTIPTPTPSPSESNPAANGNPGGSQGGGGGSGGSNNSSPLLFFVALGFGVVFTNLWIIVGVKYCFRYNARNRQLRMADDGEPINMDNMPRPHRRRREKKLMTIDEVNEKFPMLKYKTWVASRAQEGLPTRGGVSMSASRPSSVRNVDASAPELPSKERMSLDDRPTTSATTSPKPATQGPQHGAKESTSSTIDAIPRVSVDAKLAPTVSESKDENRISHYDDEEDDEHINAAIPPECMGTSGDTCAICIDTLEDDDDVRGLTCGHAFHAVCLDPWLTSRRACCPLCKADYYTPKPRPPPTEQADGTPGVITVSLANDPRHNRMNMPTRPGRSFFGFRRSSRLAAQNQFASGHRDNGRSQRRYHADTRAPRPSRSAQAGSNNGATLDPLAPRITFAGFRSVIPGFRSARDQSRSSQTGGPAASGANASSTVTPSNLEAGVR